MKERFNRILPYRNLFLLLCLQLVFTVARPQTVDKIQRSIDLIKKSLYCEDADYHTDGKRTVWVKSYKSWTPDDMPILKKEAPDVVKFLNQAIDHNRLDVLEQLLPEYYRTHGGVKAFADAVTKLRQ